MQTFNSTKITQTSIEKAPAEYKEGFQPRSLLLHGILRFALPGWR
jgi:hypothetical protein